MSRCLSCNRIMSEFELTRKYAGTQRYIDLCNRCFQTIKDTTPVVERLDLLHEESTLEEAYEDDYKHKECE